MLVASTKLIFIVALHIIAEYTAILEPVTKKLLEVNLHLDKLNQHLIQLIDVLQTHRSAEEQFLIIFAKIQKSCDIDLQIPRQDKRQTYRSNHQSDSVEEYYRKSIYIFYLDSIICSMNDRLFKKHNASYAFLNFPTREPKNSTIC